MSLEEINRRLINFLVQELGFIEDELTAQVNLFETGLLASIDVLNIIAFLEAEFEIKIKDSDVSLDNLGSIDKIVKMVQSYLKHPDIHNHIQPNDPA